MTELSDFDPTQGINGPLEPWLEFNAHGASVQGPDTSTVYTHHKVTAWLKIGKSGVIFAVSLCNIHGLWQYTKSVKVE